MKIPALLIGLLLAAPGPGQAKDSLKLGYVLYPPLIVSGGGDRPAGEVIDIVEQALSAEFDITWVKLPIGRVQWGLEQKVIDAFALYQFTPERQNHARYLPKPLLTIQSVLCSKLLIGRSFESESALVEELHGKGVISILNSATFPYADDDRIRHIKIPYDDYAERGFAMLAKSRSDYIFFPIGSSFADQIRDNELACVKVGEAQPVYFAFSKGNDKAGRVETLLMEIDTLHY